MEKQKLEEQSSEMESYGAGGAGMREIKFRAWIKDYVLMADVNFLNIDYKEIVVMIDENDYEFGCGEYELMQYTGLKDKNGKEIYEGDIVRFEAIEWTGNDGDRVEYQGVVEYSEKHIAFNFKIPIGLEAIPYEATNIEIVGNIHENPELSEVE